MKKLFLSAVAVVCALVVFAGCSLIGGRPKKFEKAGMSITLTSKFYERVMISQTAYYESPNVAVAAQKEGVFGTPASNWTLYKYAEQVIKKNGLTADLYKRNDREYLWFEYEKSASGKNFYYIATVHKASFAFWLVQFWCLQSEKDKYSEVFLSYADTITFTAASASA